MANEITHHGSFTVLKRNFKEDFKPPTIKADLSSTVSSGGVQNVGTSSHEQLAKGEVSSVGYAYFRNVGTQYNVTIGPTSDGSLSGTYNSFLTLKPGEFCVTRMSTVNIFAQAVTGATDLQYLIMSA
tara:strand:- start:217 stop:597 length:381 start_codon:yes stop_codon:yes gene_type:complete